MNYHNCSNTLERGLCHCPTEIIDIKQFLKHTCCIKTFTKDVIYNSFLYAGSNTIDTIRNQYRILLLTKTEIQDKVKY